MTRFLLALCLLVAAGCDSQDPCDAAACPPSSPPPALPTVVDGVDLAALFAAPTDDERDALAQRLGDAPSVDAPAVVSVAMTVLRTAPDATRFVHMKLRDGSGETLAHGLARIPAGSGLLPTILLLPDAPGDISEARFLTGSEVLGIGAETVQIVLAFRGATLTTQDADGQTVRFTSAAAPQPYRTDVADVLALTARLGAETRTDRARVAAVGIGRGGTAALLAAEYAPGRFKAVGSLSAPTSLFDATVLADARRLLQSGSASTLPSSAALFAPVLALRDGLIDLAEARLRLLELSPVARGDRLPALLAIHATPDQVVPVSHLDRLDEATRTPGAPLRRFARIENVPHQDLDTDSQVRSAVAVFLTDVL